MKRYITLNNRRICYDFERKKVKNINLRIKSDLSVHVSANSRVPLAAIEDFIMSKADFILNALDKYEKTAENAPKPKAYIDGEIFYLLGRELRLRVAQGTKNSVECDDSFITLTVKSADDIELKRDTMDKWYRAKSEEIVTRVCNDMYPEFQQYSIDFPQLKFRKMTSRWGSCQPARKILTFNTALVYAPIECIEYVAAHEFTHFLVPNHSNRFYERLSVFMPDWKERKKLLSKVYIR